jgi:hypothetical protein
MLDPELERIIVDAATEQARKASAKRHKKAARFAKRAARKLRWMFKTEVEVVSLGKSTVFVPALGTNLYYYDNETVRSVDSNGKQATYIPEGWFIKVGERYQKVFKPADFAPLLRLGEDTTPLSPRDLRRSPD